jgi:hypothetical protein
MGTDAIGVIDPNTSALIASASLAHGDRDTGGLRVERGDGYDHARPGRARIWFATTDHRMSPQTRASWQHRMCGNGVAPHD